MSSVGKNCGVQQVIPADVRTAWDRPGRLADILAISVERGGAVRDTIHRHLDAGDESVHRISPASDTCHSTKRRTLVVRVVDADVNGPIRRSWWWRRHENRRAHC